MGWSSLIFVMVGPSEEQRRALRERLGARTPPEWDRRVAALDRALVEGAELELTAQEYDGLLAPVVRLRLRRALAHALEEGAISSTAAAQVLGFFRHGEGGDVYLEDLLDGRRFPNLATPDFAFLRAIKDRLHEDVRHLRSVVAS
jgi:hypothetical protein